MSSIQVVASVPPQAPATTPRGPPAPPPWRGLTYLPDTFGGIMLLAPRDWWLLGRGVGTDFPRRGVGPPDWMGSKVPLGG